MLASRAATNDDGFPEQRISICCNPWNDGQISAGGVLITNRAVRMREVTDGLSNTLAVGECSDLAVDSRTGVSHRIDGGFPQSWLTGTSAVGTPPTYQAVNPPPAWNITTIRYPPNMTDYSQPGIEDNRGANNPLVAAHRGGVNGLNLDGSVHFLCDEIDLSTLKQLATRDGQTVALQTALIRCREKSLRQLFCRLFFLPPVGLRRHSAISLGQRSPIGRSIAGQTLAARMLSKAAL